MDFDYGLAPGVRKSHKKFYGQNIFKAAMLLAPEKNISLEEIKEYIRTIEEKYQVIPELNTNKTFIEKEAEILARYSIDPEIISKIQAFAIKETERETEKATFQAMEALIHNLNTMHSRAGAQTPFSSINYGMDTSPEGRMVMRKIGRAHV